MAYKTIRVEKGPGGWGGPLVLTPKPGKDKVSSVTGGGIHPLAVKIAAMCGGEAVDGFRKPPKESEVLCVVIDCGGTARVGVYPMRKIPTIDIYATSPSGPLSNFITAEYFVSGTKENNITVVE
ncbi:MAG: PTS sorbitol transporter [Ignavibacteriales bacterium]